MSRMCTTLQGLTNMSDNHGNQHRNKEYYSVNIGSGDIKYFPTRDQAPTDVEVIVASKSRENAKRQLARDFDTDFLSSNEEYLVKKRL